MAFPSVAAILKAVRLNTGMWLQERYLGICQKQESCPSYQTCIDTSDNFQAVSNPKILMFKKYDAYFETLTLSHFRFW